MGCTSWCATTEVASMCNTKIVVLFLMLKNDDYNEKSTHIDTDNEGNERDNSHNDPPPGHNDTPKSAGVTTTYLCNLQRNAGVHDYNPRDNE